MAKKISLALGGKNAKRVNGIENNKWLKHGDFEVGKAYEFMFTGTHIDNAFGSEVTKFDIADKAGNGKVLPNCGSLRFQLARGIDNGILASGDIIEVTYNGLEFVEKFGREIHKYEVDVIDVEPEGV